MLRSMDTFQRCGKYLKRLTQDWFCTICNMQLSLIKLDKRAERHWVISPSSNVFQTEE